MHIRQIDLNLLPVFDAIMAEGSLTAAANRLGMTPSAVSHALARLRTLTSDELFESNGRGVRPTRHALDISRQVRSGVALLQSALLSSRSFDPATADRTFVIDIAAGGEAVVVPELLVEMRRVAPAVRLRIASDRAAVLHGELRFGETELALDYEREQGEGLESELLYQDEFVVLARNDHPVLARRGMSRELYKSLGHVGLSWTRTQGNSPLSVRLAELGIERNIFALVTTLGAIPEIVARTDLITSLSRRVAKRFAMRWSLEVHELPFRMAPVGIYQVWHQRHSEDAGHKWLREAMKHACAGIAPH